MAIEDWDLDPANNTSVTDGTYGNVNWAEGQNSNTVNNSSRSMMAHVRRFYETLEWRDFGHTPTRTADTTFTVPDDQTSVYTAGRRIKCTDSSTLYGTIDSSAYTTLTTVTVTLDSGTLSASLSAVAVGLDPTNTPVGSAVINGLGTAATEDIGTSGGVLGKLNANKTDSGANTFTNTVTVSGSGIISIESIGNALRHKVTDDSNTQVLLVRDSNDNDVGALQVNNLDGAGASDLDIKFFDSLSFAGNEVWDDSNTATKLPGRVIGTCRISSTGTVTSQNGDVSFSASWSGNVCTVTLTGNTHGTDYVPQATVLDSGATGSQVYVAHIRSAGASSIVVQTGRASSGYTGDAWGFTLTLTAGAS